MATKICHSSQSLEALPCAAVIQYIKVLYIYMYIYVPPMYRQHVVEGLSSPLKLKRLVNLMYSRFVSTFHASYTDLMKMRTQIGRKAKL